VSYDYFGFDEIAPINTLGSYSRVIAMQERHNVLYDSNHLQMVKSTSVKELS